MIVSYKPYLSYSVMLHRRILPFKSIKEMLLNMKLWSSTLLFYFACTTALKLSFRTTPTKLICNFCSSSSVHVESIHGTFHYVTSNWGHVAVLGATATISTLTSYRRTFALRGALWPPSRARRRRYRTSWSGSDPCIRWLLWHVDTAARITSCPSRLLRTSRRRRG